MDISTTSVNTVEVIKKTNWATFDGLIHTGDFAYDIDNDNGKRGDSYFDTFKDVHTKVPYMIVPGNHENIDNTNFFNYRFRMANSDNNYEDHSNNYWTIKLANTQIFFVSYDYIIYIKPGSWKTYLAMIEKDLKASVLDKNIVWRVMMTHRPIICSDIQSHDCLTNFTYLISFSSLYRKYGVQFHFSSHEHLYERQSFMTLDFKVKYYNEKGERTEFP
jgi:acid phosphatase type 7